MMMRVEVRQVLGEAMESGASVECANGKTTWAWDALVIPCLFEHNWLGLAGSGEGPAGGAAVSASDGYRVNRSYLDLGRVLDLQVLSMSIPKGVTIRRVVVAQKYLGDDVVIAGDDGAFGDIPDDLRVALCLGHRCLVITFKGLTDGFGVLGDLR